MCFVSEDDLWCVSTDGGAARRLSANPGRAAFPALSPDGTQLAYVSRDEGAPEVYVMPLAGGAPARRLTVLGAAPRVVGWTADGASIRFASDAAQPFGGHWHLWDVAPDGGPPQPLALGPALGMARAPRGDGAVLWRHAGGRHMGDPAWWKRYRGGDAGQLWIDPRGSGRFRPLLKLDGDLASPMWIGGRIYFLSDHEGVGNIYSCRPSGADIQRHTDHAECYARMPATDGRRIVYTAGADLYLFDPATSETRRLDVSTGSTRPQRNRKFVPAGRYLQHYALHPDGHALCVTSRGKPFTFAHWEGPAVQYGVPDGVRYRLAQWLPDGKRLVGITDASGEEQVTVFSPSGMERRVRLTKDIGRVVQLAPAPAGADRVAITNHRNELFVVHLKERRATLVEGSRFGPIAGVDWSPDGRWLAYGFPEANAVISLKVYELANKQRTRVTRPDFRDYAPRFDPEGCYLYFLSRREYDPVYDELTFDLGFPRGARVLAVPLRADLRSPFEPKPRPPGEPPAKPAKSKTTAKTPARVRIDFKGIEDRVVACPMAAGRFGQLRVIPGKLLFTALPVEGSLDSDWSRTEPAPKASLVCYNLREQKRETLVDGIAGFTVSRNGKALAYRKGARLRVLQAGVKPKGNAHDQRPNRETGWVDLNRLKVSVEPGAEWRQMFLEAWRLQRDHFWTADMSGVDWPAVRDRYLPLLDRVASRSEFSDLMWETQGELGTSHAYEMGGDYRPGPRYRQGFLGTNVTYDRRAKAWRVGQMLRGDSWNRPQASPLGAPGVNVKPRDRIVAVGHRKLGPDCSPAECLVNLAAQDVQLTVADPAGKNARTVTVRTLASEEPLRYRDWVEANRAAVHAETRGRVGYVHIPDMGPEGFAEFHRYFAVEVDRDGLIVDVRHNRGGHVSQLLLEKLLRRRIGWDVARWNAPEPYPNYAPAGPMVALTNERAGSDGDMFSHAFKLYNLGPLIGTRTWGGVVGIWPRHALVDGSLTSQPEFSFWFEDVGYRVENYGTDPDIVVEITPQDHAAGRDTQLERGISEVQKLLRRGAVKPPDFSKRPRPPKTRLRKRKR